MDQVMYNREARRTDRSVRRILHLHARWSSLQFALVAEMVGFVPLSDVRRGLARLQSRNPSLRRCVVEREGLGPVFVETQQPIELHTFVATGELTWDDVVDVELDTTFETAVGPLMRATLIRDQERVWIVLTFHRLIADERSAACILVQLMEALAHCLSGSSVPPLLRDSRQRINLPASSARPPEPSCRSTNRFDWQGEDIADAALRFDHAG
jgi:hypothetical protein